MKRVATALVLIPVVVWLVLKAPWWAFAAVLAAVGLLAYDEFDRIAFFRKDAAHGLVPAGWLGMVAGLILLFSPRPFFLLLIPVLGLMAEEVRFRDWPSALKRVSLFILGVIYIFGAWRCAIGLRAINPHWLMIALLVSWAGDTAALYVGRTLGRHKLAPRISPGKTWEGSIGSVGGAVLATWIYAHYLIPEEPMAVVLAIAAMANIAGQAGDLFESALKRRAAVKDSGTMLPGHGGWLDRIDSSLFSVPVVYAAQLYMMSHVHV